jgi:5-methylcytosine-specific restriction endonuclease McrA
MIDNMIAIPKPKRIVDRKAIEAARKPYCELCGRWGTVDVHHIDSRGAGHGDEPENLISLCRVCHRKAHDGNISRDELREIKEKSRMIPA